MIARFFAAAQKLAPIAAPASLQRGTATSSSLVVVDSWHYSCQLRLLLLVPPPSSHWAYVGLSVLSVILGVDDVDVDVDVDVD